VWRRSYSAWMRGGWSEVMAGEASMRDCVKGWSGGMGVLGEAKGQVAVAILRGAAGYAAMVVTDSGGIEDRMLGLRSGRVAK